MTRTRLAFLVLLVQSIAARSPGASITDLPANRWVEVRRDPAGARPGSAVRYASQAKAFFLWGYMNDDPDQPPEFPLIRIPEYDVVAFDPSDGQWRSQLPRQMEEEWRRKLPLAYVPRAHYGLTPGSERTVLRGGAESGQGAPRPDLNIVFDQVAYRPATDTLYYFTGRLTAAYDVSRRWWSDLHPRHAPPPVLGGSLALDLVHDEVVLFGGGHVAEQLPDGSIRGHTGTWVYSIAQNDWRQLPLKVQPPPRMNTRMVCDSRNGVLVLFGGDGQRFYLSDTWLFDLKTRTWRASKAPGGPEPRAGHFTVYDPETGLVIIGGGYNRKDLADMWGYDATRDRWQRLAGQVPTGFYLTGDIAPERRLIVLATSTRPAGDRLNCNILFPVRTTYAYRIEAATVVHSDQSLRAHQPMPKRDPEDLKGMEPDAARRAAQTRKLESLPANQWVLLKDPGRGAQNRTWGSASFDTDRGRILYWGGGHCGYEGSDVDSYDVAEHTWLAGDPNPDYPERLWNHGTRIAGMTFSGRPWMEHGCRVYAYDPASKSMILTPHFRLTAGYEPDWLKSYPTEDRVAPDALVRPPSSYRKTITWGYNPATGDWRILGPAPIGVDTLVSTPHGVMGVTVHWPGRLNDGGYFLPWSPSQPPVDNAIYLLRGARWERLDKGPPSPQNLYEQTSLAYDSRRDQVILHGGGRNREELWTFDMKSRLWKQMQPKVLAPTGIAPPESTREAVYVPDEDVFLTYGNRGAMWEYSPAENAWRRVAVPASDAAEVIQRAGQNRAMVYDPKRGIVFLVLGGGGNEGKASVFALRYRHATAPLATGPQN